MYPYTNSFGVVTKKRDRSAEIEQRRVDRQVNRVLDKAQELLAGPNKDGDGWIKGIDSNYKGQYCSRGAINCAAEKVKADYTTRALAMNRLEAVMDGSVTATNDRATTTFPQVMMAFDLAKVAGKQLSKQV